MGETVSTAIAAHCCCGVKRSYGPRLVVITEHAPPKVHVESVWRNLFAQRRRTTGITPKVPTKRSEFHSDSVDESECSPTSEKYAEDEVDAVQCGSMEDEDDARTDSKEVPDGSPSKTGLRLRGTERFAQRRRNMDEGIIMAEHLAEVPKLAASVTELANDRWNIHGIHIHKVLHAGLQRLDKILEWGDIMCELPCNDKGRCLVFCKSLFKALLAGDRLLNTVPPTEAATAQKDLSYLSLRQLLRLRVLNIDFAPGGNSVQATFLSMLDGLIFQRLGRSAANSAAAADAAGATRLGRDVVLLVAIAKSLPVSQIWVCWFEDRRLFFNMANLTCTGCAHLAFSHGGVLEFFDKSEPDRIKGGQHTWLDYTVKFATDEASLGQPPMAMSHAVSSRALGNFKGAASFAPVSTDELKSALGSLKKVQRKD